MYRSMLFVSIAAIGLIKANRLPFTDVIPFKQPDAITTTEKCAVAFKPALTVVSGCYPYPAVNAEGQTNLGDRMFKNNTNCGKPANGSQIYGRSEWHKELWANMYSWYHPKDQTADGNEIKYVGSHVHEWTSIVVWVTNPLPPNKISAVATSWPVTSYKIYHLPPPSAIDGNTTRIEYRDNPDNKLLHNVDLGSSGGGEFQPLILWEQLTPKAQDALSTTNFGPLSIVPFIDANFKKNLELAYPL